MKLKYEPKAANTKNQPDLTKVFRCLHDEIVYGCKLPKNEPVKLNRPTR